MIANNVVVLSGLMVALASLGGDGPPAVPADFKILVASFGLGKEPVMTEEVVVHQGRAYLFPSNAKEVVMIDPALGQVAIVDVARRLQTEVSFATLDASVARLKRQLNEAADAREKQGGRSNILDAQMTRDLLDPKLNVSQTATNANRVRLTNVVVEVDADGEPEADAPRLALVTATMSAIARLGAFRAPSDLPPFVELETINRMMVDRKLRPTELAYLYRIGGRPRKFRRTYQLVPQLTAREVEAIDRVNRVRAELPVLRYEQYRQAR